jgi:PAS domain S-box-containing protein
MALTLFGTRSPDAGLPQQFLQGLRSTGLKHWLWALLGLMGASALVVALALGVLRVQTIATAARLTETFALVVAEQTTRTVQTIEQRLELTAHLLGHLDAANTAKVSVVNGMFQAQIQAMPFVRALWFVDAKGAVQYDSDPLNSVSDEGLPGMDVDYVALFSAQPQRDFYMGVPARGGQHGAWLIHAARPVRSASGAVTGVLVAAIDTRYFEALWRHIDLGIDGSMGLLRRDGVLLIRSPFVASAMGKSFKERPVFTTLLPAQPHGNYTDASSVDGVQRMFSYRTLSAHPDMVVIVGQSYAQVLAPWWRWVRLVLLVWVGSWGGMFGIAYLLTRVWRQKQDSEHTLRANEARYRSLYQHAMDAILVTRTDGRVLHANPAACALFDRTEADIQALGRTGLLDVSDPRLAAALATRAATGHFRGELTFIRANGDRFPGEFTTSVFTAGNGEIHTTIIIRDVSERQKTDAALQQYADKLQVLSRRIIDTQEAERRRLASELHDELGQSLTALKINLQSGVLFKNRSLEALNTENIRIVEDTLQQVRRLALALRPSILDNLGLVPALHWLGKQTAQRTHLIFEFGSIELPHRLAPELETTCFRIAQEALTNIARHAQALHFSITMELEGAVLVIRIQDDGVGMDWPAVQAAAMAGGSFGVLGMVERATLVGGELQVQSAVGQGCTLVLRCPIRAPLESP